MSKVRTSPPKKWPESWAVLVLGAPKSRTPPPTPESIAFILFGNNDNPEINKLIWLSSMFLGGCVLSDASIPTRSEIRDRLERIYTAATMLEEAMWDWDILDILAPPRLGLGMGRVSDGRSNPTGKKEALRLAWHTEYDAACRGLLWIANHAAGALNRIQSGPGADRLYAGGVGGTATAKQIAGLLIAGLWRRARNAPVPVTNREAREAWRQLLALAGGTGGSDTSATTALRWGLNQIQTNGRHRHTLEAVGISGRQRGSKILGK